MPRQASIFANEAPQTQLDSGNPSQLQERGDEIASSTSGKPLVMYLFQVTQVKYTKYFTTLSDF